MLRLSVFIGALIALSASSKDADLIANLPGLQFTPTFSQYSGYLQGETDNIQLHYWFVEAQSDPSSKPLVLWLNGGPGCSSMEGFLSENGPFTVVAGKKLEKNNQSWNQIANVLYLEAPAGVGFSYSVDGNVATDDDKTARNNLEALKNFIARFPEYRGRDFYITGESYGGVYVPTLALLVMKTPELGVNLKGIAVGNGLTSYELNDNSLIYFAAYHGLIGDNIWEPLVAECCDDPTKVMCHFTKSKSDRCSKLVNTVSNIVNSGLDIYNLYSECAGGVNTVWDRWATLNKGAFEIYRKSSSKFAHSDLGNLFRSNKYVSQKRSKSNYLRRILKPRVQMAIPCVDDTVITSYLNDPDVKRALHIRRESASVWEVCSDQVNLLYSRTYQELSKQYSAIVEAGIRTFIYNGDVDMACNFIGDEWFVDSLGFKMSEGRRSWLYTELDATKQIGGFVKKYVAQPNPKNTSLTFLTIRGSGHMAPTDKPIPTYHMYQAFIKNKEL